MKLLNKVLPCTLNHSDSPFPEYEKSNQQNNNLFSGWPFLKANLTLPRRSQIKKCGATSCPSLRASPWHKMHLRKLFAFRYNFRKWRTTGLSRKSARISNLTQSL